MISPNAREDGELVESWAAGLRKWVWGGFAPLAAEILRPVAFLGAQALYLFAPILTTFASPAEVERLARWLESPESLDHLSTSLRRDEPPGQS